MPVLEISNLKKSYASPSGQRHRVIDIPSFRLEEGEQVVLEGSSGSGKTTFLNLIAGILQSDEGSLSIAGNRIDALSEAGRDRIRANHLGYVFQTFDLLPGYTALENVELGMMFGKGVDPAYAQELLDRVGLSDRMNYRPRQLSVGQQQRVAVARALANHPELVLADEPTGNLDRARAQESLQLIREICRERQAALLLVSHDREILSQFDRVQSLEALNLATPQPTAPEAAE